MLLIMDKNDISINYLQFITLSTVSFLLCPEKEWNGNLTAKNAILAGDYGFVGF